MRPMRQSDQSDQCDQRECPPHQVARKRPMRCTSSLKRCPPHQVGRISLSAFPNGTTRVFPKCLSQTAQHVSFPSAFPNGTTFPKGTTCRLVFYTVPCWAPNRELENTKHWFYPTWNQTQVCSSQGGRSYHSAIWADIIHCRKFKVSNFNLVRILQSWYFSMCRNLWTICYEPIAGSRNEQLGNKSCR